MKCKVLVKFKDKYDETKVYKKGEIVELAQERIEEILKVGKFVEVVKTTAKRNSKAAKAE